MQLVGVGFGDLFSIGKRVNSRVRGRFIFRVGESFRDRVSVRNSEYER